MDLVEHFKELLKVHSHIELKEALRVAANHSPVQKIVINCCLGGYGFSPEAYDWMVANGYRPLPDDYPDCFKPDRSHPLAVAAVEQLGVVANGYCASLKVVEIPQGVGYTIFSEEGYESVSW